MIHLPTVTRIASSELAHLSSRTVFRAENIDGKAKLRASLSLWESRALRPGEGLVTAEPNNECPRTRTPHPAATASDLPALEIVRLLSCHFNLV
jgi:hypothetical protein